MWIEEGATDREVTPVPGHPAVGQSLAAVRLSPAVARRWPRKALAGRATGLAPVQLDEAAATARHLPGGVGADGPVLDAAAHRRGSVRAPRVDYTPPGRDLLLHQVGWNVPRGVECVGARPARGRERRGTDQGPAGGKLARDKGTVANLGAWGVFEDGSGETLRPPKRAHLGPGVALGRRGDSCRWLRWWRRGPAIGRG
jgi:hypothetical protein